MIFSLSIWLLNMALIIESNADPDEMPHSTFCGISSGSVLFSSVPFMGCLT